jgi:hypothetical protein
MTRTNRGKDEETILFVAKIIAPIVISFIVAVGIDISSAKKGAHSFVEEAKAVCVSCHSSSY